jgi:hypothetical protein
MPRLSAALLRPAVAPLALALLLAPSGSVTERVATLRVVPATGLPGTAFVVSFVSPDRTGVTGSTRLRDTLTVTSDHAGQSCLAEVDATAPNARRGQRVRVRLDPGREGGRWCPGVYRGTVLELQTAVCPQSRPCPTYVLIRRRIGNFTLRVRASTDSRPPLFSGLQRASACTPGPQRPGQTTPYTLAWQPARDGVTPAGRIVYDVYYSTTPGGEDFSKPTWTTAPGATTFRTPGLPSHGDAYFVVRARDASGNEDGNTREQKGLDPCV